MDSFIWIRNDLYDLTIPRLTVDMVSPLDDAELLKYLHKTSGGNYHDFEMLELPELREMTVQVYHDKLKLMNATTDHEESKEDSSEPPSELNEGFIAPPDQHQTAV